MKNMKHSMTILLAALTVAAAVCYTSHRSGRRAGIAEVRVCDKVMNLGRSNGDCVNNATLTPVGVSVFHGGCEMVCQNAIVSCALKRGACDCANCMEMCNLAKFSELRYPTVGKCLEIYSGDKELSMRTVSIVRSRINTSMKRLGLPMETPINVFTHRLFKTLVDKMSGEGLRKDSIGGALSAFKAITSERFIDQLEAEGLEPFTFTMPKVRSDRNEVKVLTESQKVDVDQMIYTLRQSDGEDDKNMFKAIFFERMLAMRPVDINRLKWKNLENEFGKIVLRYTPTKTEKKTHKRSNITLGPRLVELIKPFMGDPEEHVLVRNARSGCNETHGFYSGRNATLWKRVNEWCRSHGICDGSKASYIFRRQRITDAFAEGGFQASMAVGLNTPKIQAGHYIGKVDYVAA